MTTPARPLADRVLHDLSQDLPDDDRAPRAARALVREALHAWRLTGLLDDAELVVSELVTNALRHGLPPVTLSLQHTATALTIGVRDLRPALAQRDLPVASEDDDESGRGLGIVDASSDRCGVDTTDAEGKSSFAEWDLE